MNKNGWGGKALKELEEIQNEKQQNYISSSRINSEDNYIMNLAISRINPPLAVQITSVR